MGEPMNTDALFMASLESLAVRDMGMSQGRIFVARSVIIRNVEWWTDGPTLDRDGPYECWRVEFQTTPLRDGFGPPTDFESTAEEIREEGLPAPRRQLNS